MKKTKIKIPQNLSRTEERRGLHVGQSNQNALYMFVKLSKNIFSKIYNKIELYGFLGKKMMLILSLSDL